LRDVSVTSFFCLGEWVSVSRHYTGFPLTWKVGTCQGINLVREGRGKWRNFVDAWEIDVCVV